MSPFRSSGDMVTSTEPAMMRGSCRVMARSIELRISSARREVENSPETSANP